MIIQLASDAPLVVRTAAGAGLVLHITGAATGLVAGTVSLFALNRAQKRAEVGYALAANVWGRGYATEALKLAVDFAFETVGVARLEADIDPRNEASCRLVERIGFVREGLLRERWHVAGEATDSAMYGLLARDLASR